MKKKLLPAPATVSVIPTPELVMKAHEGTPQYGDYGHPPAASAPPVPDHRAAGGDVYDLDHEQSAL